VRLTVVLCQCWERGKAIEKKKGKKENEIVPRGGDGGLGSQLEKDDFFEKKQPQNLMRGGGDVENKKKKKKTTPDRSCSEEAGSARGGGRFSGEGGWGGAHEKMVSDLEGFRCHTGKGGRGRGGFCNLGKRGLR